jgi:amino acid transporter
MHGQNSLTSYVVMGVAIVLIIALRFRRMGRDRPLRLDGLWVLPAIYGAILIVAFAQAPPDMTGWTLIGIGLVLGGVAGWLRGRTITISVDPATGTLNQHASPLGLIPSSC